MAQDVIGRDINPDDAVFYNGVMYRVTKTKGKQVYMNYLGRHNQLMRDKVKYGDECCIVEGPALTAWLLTR
jgi:hypothetical protein